MIVMAKLILCLAVFVITSVLTDEAGANPAASVLAFFGAVSFFIGPYLTGSGFYIGRGHSYVDTPTPPVVWKMAGIIGWIIAAIVYAKTIGTA